MPTGEPKLPKNAADTFKKQCGVLVRDHVPISVREWNKRKGQPIVTMSPKGTKIIFGMISCHISTCQNVRMKTPQTN